LLGTKVVLTEFIAYVDLSSLVAAGTISPKTIAMATFALCGFANFASIAIQIGGIGGIAPGRKSELAEFGIRAVIAGTMANLMTATIAGILY
jgi:CNT family concentrative nucleoside transporter